MAKCTSFFGTVLPFRRLDGRNCQDAERSGLRGLGPGKGALAMQPLGAEPDARTVGVEQPDPVFPPIDEYEKMPA